MSFININLIYSMCNAALKRLTLDKYIISKTLSYHSISLSNKFSLKKVDLPWIIVHIKSSVLIRKVYRYNQDSFTRYWYFQKEMLLFKARIPLDLKRQDMADISYQRITIVLKILEVKLDKIHHFSLKLFKHFFSCTIIIV